MKVMKILVLSGLLLLAAGTAGAATAVVPSISGAIYLQANNNDQGTSYTGAPGTYTRAAASDPWVGVTPTAATEGNPGEDSWGVFILHNLQSGTLVPGDIVPDPTTIFYTASGGNYATLAASVAAQGSTVLVGTFWGGWDNQVTLSATSPNLEVYATGVNFALYAVPIAEATAATYGVGGVSYSPGQRTLGGAGYKNWADPGGTTPNAVLLMAGTSTEFRFAGTQTAAGAFNGNTVTYWDIDATQGQWGPMYGTSGYFTDELGNKADLRMTFTDQVGTAQNWATLSKDDGGMVPEPVTMFSAFLAISGLGAYIRRRMKVTAA